MNSITFIYPQFLHHNCGWYFDLMVSNSHMLEILLELNSVFEFHLIIFVELCAKCMFLWFDYLTVSQHDSGHSEWASKHGIYCTSTS
jgi:hypothetical protein